jgi:hypothetical protein
MILEVGQEINYKGIELIYSGFQMENKLCFYIKDGAKMLICLSLTQVKKLIIT